ncbi:U-box domain-containing protein 11-like [Salvia miltiorrhiza]|uniref:U-box domain-containing protein 11-like n=1 Tax=Salvia miltiorrhiza TaxID=226208 RepID=UPI0025AD8A34|nr:U-box domain-containing protein 11-like [Salvia miltiorrhiza]XP_057787689.1 U-box domain-containing protein 11-like [Salvia miltiorrhiza]
MAGGDTLPAEGGATAGPLRLVRDLARISSAGFSGFFKKDCSDLARRVSLLAHLLEEIRDSSKIPAIEEMGSSSCYSFLTDLTMALQAAKRLVFAANNFENSKVSSDGATKKIYFQFQCVTWKLDKALIDLPYDDFDISEEVQEQVELVRSQLRRASERYGGPLKSSILYRALSQPLDKEIDPFQSGSRSIRSLHVDNTGIIDHEVGQKVEGLLEGNGLENHATDNDIPNIESLIDSSTSHEISAPKDSDSVRIESSTCGRSVDENKKLDSPLIPVDFLCPISLELMKDPVIVATGQTYERSYIQRWIDCGNTTCPKTQQKLRHLTLTPNYVLRSLISQWCMKHGVEQTTPLMNGRIKKSDGSFRDVTGDIAAVEALVRKLSSRSTEERRVAVAEIRSLSKRSTDNRILLAEAGAIPILVNLLTCEDAQIQDNAVTSILNLSIYENNKGLIMLANAIPSIVQVLRAGSMEAKENAAATLFSLSLADENKIIIGASGAIPALVDLLQNGSSRGKKDAATALFNLCIYHGNKGRAVRAGIITALLKMLTDSSSCMVDEALTILSVLASHQEAKSAIVKASTIPVLIDLLRTGLPRNKENASAILLSLCKRDHENLACLSRLGAVIPLTELANTGTERAKRKANSLLETLRKSQQV